MGGKYWRFKYRFGGKEKTLALGVYPDLSLAKAREKRQEARERVVDGIDPGVVKRLKKIHQSEEEINGFEALAREWFETRMVDKSKQHQSRTIRALESQI